MELTVKFPLKPSTKPSESAPKKDVFVRTDFRVEGFEKEGDWQRISATSPRGQTVEGWVKADLLVPVDAPEVGEEITIGSFLSLLTFEARTYGANRDYLAAVAWLKSGIKNKIQDREKGPIGPFQFLTGEWDELVKRYDLKMGRQDIFVPGNQAAVAAALTNENTLELTGLFEERGEELKRPNSADLYLAHLLGKRVARTVLKTSASQPINKPLLEFYSDRDGSATLVDSIIDGNRDLMVKDGQTQTIEGTLATLIVTLDEAYAAIEPHVAALAEDLRPPRANQMLALLGTLSRKYETGKRGPGTVSSGEGDPGGVSYGSYQMSTNRGIVEKFVAEAAFPWRDRFTGKTPGSDDFTTAWKALADEESEAFLKTQHDYIKKTHFDLLVEKIKSEDGLDVTQRSHALQDVVWSTAVHHGPNTPVVHRAIGNLGGPQTLTDLQRDRALIKAVYAERGKRNDQGKLAYFESSSDSVQQSIADRFVNEERDALAMFDRGA